MSKIAPIVVGSFVVYLLVTFYAGLPRYNPYENIRRDVVRCNDEDCIVVLPTACKKYCREQLRTGADDCGLTSASSATLGCYSVRNGNFTYY